MYKHYKKGSVVTVYQTSSGVRTSGPAANWIKGPTKVRLLEDAISGTWDVFDAQTVGGEEKSVYGFNIRP